jgi:hypothetical protein
MTKKQTKPSAEEKARLARIDAIEQKKGRKTFEDVVTLHIEYDYFEKKCSQTELEFLDRWQTILRQKKAIWAKLEERVELKGMAVMGVFEALRTAKRDNELGEDSVVRQTQDERARMLELAEAAELLAHYFEEFANTPFYESDLNREVDVEFQEHFGQEPYWEIFIKHHKLQAAAFRNIAPPEEPPGKVSPKRENREQFRFMYHLSHWMRYWLRDWHTAFVLETAHLVYPGQEFTVDQIKQHR